MRIPRLWTSSDVDLPNAVAGEVVSDPSGTAVVRFDGATPFVTGLIPRVVASLANASAGALTRRLTLTLVTRMGGATPVAGALVMFAVTGAGALDSVVAVGGSTLVSQVIVGNDAIIIVSGGSSGVIEVDVVAAGATAASARGIVLVGGQSQATTSWTFA